MTGVSRSKGLPCREQQAQRSRLNMHLLATSERTRWYISEQLVVFVMVAKVDINAFEGVLTFGISG
jgi:hypothetical protein